ncbi:hypothetical protein ACFE04_002546 [Oxalis oulophora]
MMQLQRLLRGAKHYNFKHNGGLCASKIPYHSLSKSHEELLPYESYEKAFPRIARLANNLKNVDLIDGRLVNINDDSTIFDDRIEERMRKFKSLVTNCIGSPTVRMSFKKDMESLLKCNKSFDYFGEPSARYPMVIDSLTKISNYLNISPQQRKKVRFNLCPQITEHRMWTGTLEEILKGLKLELDLLDDKFPSNGSKMGKQILSKCVKFLAESSLPYDPDSTSWMRLAPAKVADTSSLNKWGDVLEMFNDLIECLDSESENGLVYHLKKIVAMKEGLSQIKDVLVDRSIGYREVRHHENLLQKKLTKTLGHSSKCLFTLLLYYLHRRVRDIEVDVCGGIYGSEKNGFCLSMGRILSSDEEKMIGRGVKHLDRALGLFKFVWEMAAMKGSLELQGHLWCVGAKTRMLRYRGNVFFVHGINL